MGKSCRFERNSPWRDVWNRLKKNRPAVAGLFVVVLFAGMALFADVIADYESQAIAQNMAQRLQGPSLEHIFGTDAYGRDLFARVVHGSRVSLSIGFLSTGISLVIGGFLGAAAGYYGGKTDDIIMRLMDTVMCIPPMLLALAIVSSLGHGMRNMILAVTAAQIPGFARVIRSAILSVVEQEYIAAAKTYGAGDLRIILRYVLPNALGPIIVQATMEVSGMIIVAAGLSFVGMGVAPPQPEWGSMISEARDYMMNAPHLIFFPGVALVLVALSVNLLGDGLRDALDPRLKD